MVVVTLNRSLEDLSSDLFSAITWSSVGLKSLKELRNSLFQEFNKRDLEFSLTYESVTPLANQDIEMEYINEVKCLGKEELLNLEDWVVDEPEEEVNAIDELEGIFIPRRVVDTTRRNLVALSIDFEDKEPEVTPEVEEPIPVFEEPTPKVEEFTPVFEEPSLEVDEPEPIIETPIVESITPKIQKATTSSPNNLSIDGLDISDFLSLEDEKVESIQKPKEVAIKKAEITKTNKEVYTQGMSLREFLRENPRSSMDVVEKYFTRKEIMKNIQLGKVIKRGSRLFI